MEVPFVSSGAISRAHYALVRKVETAPSPQVADQYLLTEVDSIRDQLARSTLTLRQCRECLILLLYCSTSVDSSSDLDLDFALRYAVNLAESGQSVRDKRIGYLFCAEIMPPDHELQLMLVNTLRKDLENTAIPRICLALDTLIQFSTEDVIPAIQSRLIDLLSHNSLHVRRRALLAFHRLSRYDPGILREIVSKTQRRLKDQDTVVISAALTLCADLVKAGHMQSDQYHGFLTKCMTSSWRARPDPTRNWLLVKTLRGLQLVSLTQDDLRVILKIIQMSCKIGSAAYATLYECFWALSSTPPESLLLAQSASKTTLVEHIRSLLTSSEPNDLFLLVSCLECLDVQLWAGSNPDVPAVLEGWEVERVMKLLDSDDKCIRRKTVRLLQRVDHSIVETVFSRMLQGDLESTEAHDSDEMSRRLLEIIEVMCGEDGELYAQHVKNMLQTVEGDGPLQKRQVLQEAVEEILVYIRNANLSFRSACIGNLFVSVTDSDAQIGPTMMVILTALITEYLQLAPMSPVGLLSGLSARISLYSASIQDACLLCMMRLAASCDEVPNGVTEVVTRLHEQSGRYIRRRCEQFTSLILLPGVLKNIASSARSSSLPDFVAALELHEAQMAKSPVHSPLLQAVQSPERSVSRNSNSPHKLRYDAYDPPKAIQRLRRYSSSSSRASDDGSSRFVGQSRVVEDALSRTITPGDLALATREDLETISTGSPPPVAPALPVVQILDEDDSATRVDLIALDSPFVSEPLPTMSTTLRTVEPDFENIWNGLESFNLRGWCEMSIDVVVRRLQGMHRRLKVISEDQDPFKGELKVMVSSLMDPGEPHRVAVLRLKASDDESCLWRLRCEDDMLRNTVKDLLSET